MCHRVLAAWLVAFALLMKVLVPSGYMFGRSAGSMTIELCSGFGPQSRAMAMPGMAGHGDEKQKHGKAEQPCAFAGLSAPSLAGADSIALVGLIAFVMMTLFRSPSASVVLLRAFLRPRLRGPPAAA